METMASTLLQEPSPDLTVSDRCDRCPAQAYVRVTKGAAHLELCAHHFHRSEDALVTSGWAVSLDVRERLLVTP
jgi:hypothetical protein